MDCQRGAARRGNDTEAPVVRDHKRRGIIMAYYDLSQEGRKALDQKLKHREAFTEMGAAMPPELEMYRLMAEYSLTEADWKAVLKGREK